MSPEEPEPPQAFAAAQKVAGTGQCWLPKEKQGQVRTKGIMEAGH